MEDESRKRQRTWENVGGKPERRPGILEGSRRGWSPLPGAQSPTTAVTTGGNVATQSWKQKSLVRPRAAKAA